MISLKDVELNKDYIIKEINTPNASRLVEIGLYQGATVNVFQRYSSIIGTIVCVNGSCRISLDTKTCKSILVEEA